MSKQATAKDSGPADAGWFKDLMASERRFATVPVSKWKRTVRLIKLTVPEALELLDWSQQFPRDETGQFKTTEDSVKFAAELAARSIVSGENEERPFDSKGGREYLRRESMSVLNELMAAALDLNELGELPDQIGAAKKK